MQSSDVRSFNRSAWDRQVEERNPWTIPISTEEVQAARQGRWQILLTPSRPVPRAWFPEMNGLDVLCLASGGGQQGPILAAAGAEVTVLDNSPLQLAQDRSVAERDSLRIVTVEADMADLSMFEAGHFGLILHPVSNCFAPEIRPVWAEAFRVLQPGGALLAGFNNPVVYLFDFELAEQTGVLQARYRLPYSDLESLPEEEVQRYLEQGEPLEFGHTLDDQIGGQLDAGFVITGFYEDGYGEPSDDPLSAYMSTFIATRAIKP